MNTISKGLFDSAKDTASGDSRPTIMVVGIGDLAKHVVNQLACRYATGKIVLAGRNHENLVRRANLARYAAANQGWQADISACEMDLKDVEKTAEALLSVKPDIILMTASLQSWRRLTELPKAVFEEIDEAQFGPWLPMHLALNYNLMQAIRASGIKPITVNAAFPDAVNPILDKVGLAPDLGTGNVANIIPALSFGVSELANLDAQSVQVRLVAQHYFTHFVPRYGHEGNGAYHLSATNTQTGEAIEFSHAQLFQMLNGVLRRQGGVEGQLLTAASTSRVIAAIAENSQISAHTPAPNGLPGGYPVIVGAEGATLDLPADLSVDRAIEINEVCQEADGIKRIEDDGTVWFAKREMKIMDDLIGYNISSMKLSDVWQQADELTARFSQFKQAASTSLYKEVV